MSYKVKDIDLKNRTYYSFNDIINIKNFDPNNIKMDEKSYKNILVYYIEYVLIKDSFIPCKSFIPYFQQGE